jgi:hypothetical protein
MRYFKNKFAHILLTQFSHIFNAKDVTVEELFDKIKISLGNGK